MINKISNHPTSPTCSSLLNCHDHHPQQYHIQSYTSSPKKLWNISAHDLSITILKRHIIHHQLQTYHRPMRPMRSMTSTRSMGCQSESCEASCTSVGADALAPSWPARSVSAQPQAHGFYSIGQPSNPWAKPAKTATCNNFSLERGPRSEWGPGSARARARPKGLQIEAFGARARARGPRTSFTPRTPFKGNCVMSPIWIKNLRPSVFISSTSDYPDQPKAKTYHTSMMIWCIRIIW